MDILNRKVSPYIAFKRSWRRETMAKGQVKSNKEARKPKKEVKKTIAANPSTKGTVVKD